MRRSWPIALLGLAVSVREAARQRHIETASSGSESTIIAHWLRWSAKHKWVSRGLARDEWIARTSDEQVVANVTACKLALTRRAHDFLASKDSEVWLRGASAFTLQHPPVQRVEDVTQIEDLSHLSDEALERMREIRDAGRKTKDDSYDDLPVTVLQLADLQPGNHPDRQSTPWLSPHEGVWLAEHHSN